MKKNAHYIALFAVLAACMTPSAQGMWRLTEMGRWKKGMEDLLRDGQYRDVEIALLNLRNKPNQTKQDQEKITFLEILTEQE